MNLATKFAAKLATTALVLAGVSCGDWGGFPGIAAVQAAQSAESLAESPKAPWSEKLELKMADGPRVALERVAPPKPEVFAGAPAYALWTRKGFAEPVSFQLSVNHAAFVRNWRLLIYRAGDLERRRPVQTLSGRGMSFADSPSWDGSEAPGAVKLRPGEELFYVFEATDRLGRVAASDPAPLLIARYVMPQQARALKPMAQATTLPERPEMEAGRAYGLKISVEGLKPGETLRVDGLAVKADASGKAETVQILPAGRYEPKIELTRPRGRMAEGRLAFDLGAAAAHEPRPLWGARSAAAVALATTVAAPTRRAYYELANQTMINLPDTDVERDSLRAVITVEGETAAALSAGEHYVLDFLQGRLALTSAGRDLMDGVAQGLEEGGQKGRLEIGYRLAAERAAEPPAEIEPAVAARGDGADFVVTYGDAFAPEMMIAAAEALIAETEAAIAESPELAAVLAERAVSQEAEAVAAPVELAQLAPPPKPARPVLGATSPAAPSVVEPPRDSPAPRAKPRPAAQEAAPVPTQIETPAETLIAAAPPSKAEAAPQGAPVVDLTKLPFDEPVLAGFVRPKIQAPVMVAAAPAPAKPAAQEAEAQPPSLVAQGLFIAASAPAGFDSGLWSESPAARAAESRRGEPRPARSDVVSEAPLASAPSRSMAHFLTQGFILDGN